MADRHVSDTHVGSQHFSSEQIDVFHLLWAKCPEPRCVKDQNGCFVFVNEAYRRIFSIPSALCVEGLSEEALQMTLDDKVNIISGGSASLTELVFSDAKFILKIINDFSKNTEYFYFDKYPIFNPDESVCGFYLNGRSNFILSLNMFSKGKCAVKIKTTAPYSEITDRQWEIIYYLQQNYSAQEISEILQVSLKTINNNIYRLYRKTGSKGYRDFLDFCEAWDLANYLPPSLQQHIHR